jgi:hypothetical protein
MSKFTFADFLVFSGTSNTNEDTYVTIAKGVISYINEQYGIYPELATVTKTIFLSTGQVSIQPNLSPIVTVDSIVYDGTTYVDEVDYTYYGEDILLTTAVTTIRKPLTITYSVGYTSVPDNLILAIYRHILAVYHAIDKHADNISKAVNTEGNTTYLINDVVPLASLQTYNFYAGHTLASV